MLAAAVALVAHRLLLQHDAGVGAELGGAAARALLGRGGQEHLDLGVGRDDAADVTALGDPVALPEDAPLLGDQRLAHAGVGRHARRGLGDPRLADALGDVLAVDEHALPELDAHAAGDRGRVGGVLGAVGHRAVHRPRVEVREAEPLRGGAGDPRLPAPAGPSMAMTMTSEARVGFRCCRARRRRARAGAPTPRRPSTRCAAPRPRRARPGPARRRRRPVLVVGLEHVDEVVRAAARAVARHPAQRRDALAQQLGGAACSASSSPPSTLQADHLEAHSTPPWRVRIIIRFATSPSHSASSSARRRCRRPPSRRAAAAARPARGRSPARGCGPG